MHLRFRIGMNQQFYCIMHGFYEINVTNYKTSFSIDKACNGCWLNPECRLFSYRGPPKYTSYCQTKRFSLMVSQYFLVHIVFIWMLPVRYISNCFFCSGIFANPIQTDVFVNNTIDTVGIEFLFTTQCLISPGFNDNTLIS